ncbi:sulfatase family protein [Tautonia plasticadhaerens]|uniref:Arylsulfatase n=1 Tax=Tautonia plasticadhaerens TaxID=2527974 RepID=A0A518GV52_9BACT|nr:sulfatase [Tautonia plasticadhaerens]QDV32463.1 Arylsulfatase [Tautonia plasticadhaerens]
MIRSALALAVALLALPPRPAPARQDGPRRPPSILVLLADDVSWKDFGCYGHPTIRTPNIDALASGGLRFANAFLTTSSCSPTRVSVLTGKYPHATGAEDLHMNLPEHEAILPSLLKAVGYHTGHMLKTHYGPAGDAQFDWYGTQVVAFPSFLDEAGDRPFFTWVGFRDAHRPYTEGAIDDPHTDADAVVPPFLADTPETRSDLALYYDEIARMDGHIGRMVAELEARGRLDDTLIVFFADNGMPFPRAKGTLYDSGIGTPLVMSWPDRIDPGTVHEGLASVIDLAPTFLELAGLPTPADMQGRSMVPVLDDPSNPGHAAVFSERNWHNCDEHMRSIRTEHYKLIRNAYLDLPHGSPSDVSSCPSWDALLALKAKGALSPAQAQLFQVPRPPIELYDLQSDPSESDNLAILPEHAEIVSELAGRLDDWAAATGDYPPTYRRRADNCDRVTGEKFSQDIAPMTDPLPPGFGRR